MAIFIANSLSVMLPDEECGLFRLSSSLHAAISVLACASDENSVSLRAFVTQAAVEAFYEAMLHRLAQCDIV